MNQPRTSREMIADGAGAAMLSPTTTTRFYLLCRADGLPAWRALDMARVWCANVKYHAAARECADGMAWAAVARMEPKR
jgi:hypothetical protein